MRVLRRGAENRHVGETRLNRESSRSHSVFTCVIERHSREAPGDGGSDGGGEGEAESAAHTPQRASSGGGAKGKGDKVRRRPRLLLACAAAEGSACAQAMVGWCWVHGNLQS